MIQQPDSIHREQVAAETVASHTASVLEVKTDSTVATEFSSKTNHWPVKVDSLLRPDQGKELQADVKPLPKYYKETFFAKDSLLHSELQGGRYGIAGDPVPYTVHGDNYLTMALILSTLLLMLGMKRSSRFFMFQIKNFFRVVRTDSSLERESASEKRYLVLAELHTAIILSLEFFFYSKAMISDTYITFSEYTLMGFYLACVIGFLLFERVLYVTVNSIFFTSVESGQWTTVKMMSTAWAGILLTPMILLVAYFGLSTENSLVYTLCVIIFIKLLLFYKAFLIFFKKRGAFLQNFLYFCTLELVPPLILWGVLVTIANYLKVIY